MGSVVIAEDDLEYRRVIADAVRRLGHEVALAGDGQAGLAAVLQHHPDLVIADVDLPHLDGLQMCRAIHDDPRLAAIPVVLVTYGQPNDPTMTAAGAAGVLHKPFSRQEATDAIRPHLDERDPADGTAWAAPTYRRDLTGEAAGNERFIDALLHSLDTGVVACDTGGRLVVFNQAMRDFFGADSQSVPVQDWVERYSLSHHDGTPLRHDELPLMRALAGEEVQQAGLLIKDQHGRPRWFAVNGRPIRDATGATLGAVAAVHDVTADHRARKYQECKSEVLRVLADTPDTATAGQLVLGAIATSLQWPYLRLWLVDVLNDRMRPVAIYTAPGDQALPIPESVILGEGLAGQCWQRGELVWVPDVRAPDSPVLPEVASSSTYRAAGAVPVRSGDRVIGVLTFFSHDRQEPEPALAVLLTGIAGNVGAYLEQRRAEELALHLAASVDEYISLVGHELRTPLTSISAYADLIAESPDPTPLGEVRGLLDVVIRNSTKLREIIEQLLDLAALESGHSISIIAAVDLPALVATVVEAIGPTAAECRIAIHTALPGRLSVPGDPDRLGQVIHSLLSNAIKYSPDSSTVTVALTSDEDAATLTITDAGIGVPADEEPQLFQRLYRATNARHHGIPGAGLGLALSRAIVQAHHGTIALAPAKPTGTTVTVRLPRTGH